MKKMQGKFHMLPKRMAVVLLCGTALSLVPVFAQTPDAPPPPPPPAQDGMGRGPGGGMGHGPMEMMSKELNLTEDQKPKVAAIMEERRKQMNALRADTSMTMQEKRPKMMAIMKDSNDRVKALLTDEQSQKFDEIMAHMRQRRGPGGDGPPPPPPPQ